MSEHWVASDSRRSHVAGSCPGRSCHFARDGARLQPVECIIDDDGLDETDRQALVRAGWSVGPRHPFARFAIQATVKASKSPCRHGNERHGEWGLTPEGSAGAWSRDLRRRCAEAGLRFAADGGRKRIGSAWRIGHAQPCATVSSQGIRIGRSKERAREGIQAPRMSAHLFAGVTNRGIFDCSSLSLTSQASYRRGRVRTSAHRRSAGSSDGGLLLRILKVLFPSSGDMFGTLGGGACSWRREAGGGSTGFAAIPVGWRGKRSRLDTFPRDYGDGRGRNNCDGADGRESIEHPPSLPVVENNRNEAEGNWWVYRRDHAGSREVGDYSPVGACADSGAVSGASRPARRLAASRLPIRRMAVQASMLLERGRALPCSQL